MPKILLIADDPTGILDTAVKFASGGIPTLVTLNDEYAIDLKQDNSVLALCVPTRHISPEDAYKKTYKIVKKYADKFDIVFQKTDSALRGNIGAELQALLDGSGEKEIAFFPSLPCMNRNTIGGVHYIDGVPVSKSVFGEDPFDPVKDDKVADVLRHNCNSPIVNVPINSVPAINENEATIYVYDSVTAEDMYNSVMKLNSNGRIRLIAGCSSLAEVLSPKKKNINHNDDGELLVLSGSMNPISLEQLNMAEKNGFYRFHLPIEYLSCDDKEVDDEMNSFLNKLQTQCALNHKIIIDSISIPMNIDQTVIDLNEKIRVRVAERMGKVLKALLDSGVQKRVMIIGGDTLEAFLTKLNTVEIVPITELADGVVLTKLHSNDYSFDFISKSGGFGDKDLLLNL